MGATLEPLSPPDRSSPSARLDTLLSAIADPALRTRWERYLKGGASFRGVPMAGIRRAMSMVWVESGLDEWPVDDLLALADDWFSARWSEDKLAAVLLIAERLAPRLRTSDGPALRSPVARGHLADWNVVDWYSVKAVHGFLVSATPAEVEARARSVAGWTTGAGLWERRAGLVAFVTLAGRPDEPFAGFTELVLRACAANLVSRDRFAHTGPGWVLRELSRHHPDEVRAFVAANPELSTEGRRMATARLREGPYRRR